MTRHRGERAGTKALTQTSVGARCLQSHVDRVSSDASSASEKRGGRWRNKAPSAMRKERKKVKE